MESADHVGPAFVCMLRAHTVLRFVPDCPSESVRVARLHLVCGLARFRCLHLRPNRMRSATRKVCAAGGGKSKRTSGSGREMEAGQDVMDANFRVVIE